MNPKKEAASGVGRLKWDAKVRMKQAKLRATGENVDRQQVVEAIIEESVQAAQHGVVERFDEIARDRGFHEDAVGKRKAPTYKTDLGAHFLYFNPKGARKLPIRGLSLIPVLTLRWVLTYVAGLKAARVPSLF